MPSSIIIYGIECEIPDQPAIKDLDGSLLRKDKQKFRRVEFPSSLDEITVLDDGTPSLDEEQKEFIFNELYKCKNGYWFLNNGTPTYITGDHYYYLNYWVLEHGELPNYRDSDRRWFLFYNECYNDPNILGIIRGKKRREGATSQATAIMTKLATSVSRTRCGIMSKVGKDAEKVFKDMVLTGFNSLPFFLQPQVESSESKTELRFEEKTKKKKASVNTISLHEKKGGLNSSITYSTTTFKAFDGGRWYTLIDEAAKMPADLNLYEYWENTLKKTTLVGTKKVGFCTFISTSAQPKDGGANFKKLWESSNQFKDGRNTRSKLIRYFAPANDGFEGYIDEYGISDMDGAKERILLERTSDLGKLTDPLSEEEMFSFEQGDNPLNITKIEKQEAFLRENNIPLRIGSLYLDGTGKVQFSDDKNGNWKIYKFPKVENNFIVRNGIMYPQADYQYAIGCDPYRHNILSGSGSMGSIFVGEKLDLTNEDDTCLPVAHYIGRPKMKDLFWKETLMAAMYYGCPVLFEKDASDDYYPYFKGKNILDTNCFPMLGRKPDAIIDPGRKAKYNPRDHSMSSADPFALEKQLTFLIAYIEHHCHKIYFPDLLAEFKEYDHSNRTKYDSTVSFMIMLLSLTGQNRANTAAKKETPMLNIYTSNPFKTHNFKI